MTMQENGNCSRRLRGGDGAVNAVAVCDCLSTQG